VTTFDPAHIIAWHVGSSLFDDVLHEDDASTKASLCLEQDNGQPNPKGVVLATFGIKQYPQALGQPDNAWSNHVFCFTGGVLHRNTPTSVELGPTM
jgi:hypothetical protein